MFYQEFQPNKYLTKYIKCYWVLVQPFSPNGHEPELIMPDGCPEIIFNLETPFRRHYLNKIETQPQSILAGQIKQHISIEPSKRVNLFGVRFHPNGIYPLVKQSLKELTNKIESLDTILGNSGKLLEQKIFEAKNVFDRIGVFEDTMNKALFKHSSSHLVERTLNEIIEKKGLVKIDMLVKHFDTNSKTLERHFNREVGVSPKFFCRITRLQEILRILSSSKIENWAHLAYSFDYVDQAHFIKDFRSFAGATPKMFSAQNTSLSDSFVG